MKAVLFVVILALLSAFAFAQSNTLGPLCIPNPFSLTHNSTQIVYPGVLSLYVGYQVSIAESSSSSLVSISGASVTFTASCPDLSTVTFTSPIANETYSVPASSGWIPSELYMSGFQSGAMAPPAVCGQGVTYAITNAVFNAGLLASQNDHAISIRFTYFVYVNTAALPAPPAGLPQPPPITGSTVSIWLGNGAYSVPIVIMGQLCPLALLSKSNTGSISPTDTPSVSTSATDSPSVSRSVPSATQSHTHLRTAMLRTTILGSARKYLKRD